MRIMFNDFTVMPSHLNIEDEKAFIEKMERQAEMVEALGLLRQEAGPGQ